MAERYKRTHPALKHGAYTSLGLLPGENRTEFEKLLQELIAEFTPRGPSENEIVASIARYTWRKKNLSTIRSATFARARFAEIKRSMVVQSAERARAAPQSWTSMSYPVMGFEESPAGREAIRVATDQAEEELGDLYALCEIGESATMSGLRDELELHEQLDGLIEKCVKRLLLVRGVKSISPLPDATPKPIPRLVSRRT